VQRRVVVLVVAPVDVGTLKSTNVSLSSDLIKSNLVFSALRSQCYHLIKYFRQKNGEKKLAKILLQMIAISGFEEKRQFFLRK
jgi:hypothetical protein